MSDTPTTGDPFKASVSTDNQAAVHSRDFKGGDRPREETRVPQPDTPRSPKPTLPLSDPITTTVHDNNYKSYLQNALQLLKHIHVHYFV